MLKLLNIQNLSKFYSKTRYNIHIAIWKWCLTWPVATATKIPASITFSKQISNIWNGRDQKLMENISSHINSSVILWLGIWLKIGSRKFNFHRSFSNSQCKVQCVRQKFITLGWRLWDSSLVGFISQKKKREIAEKSFWSISGKHIGGCVHMKCRRPIGHVRECTDEN